MGINTISPVTGEILKSFESITEAELEQKLTLAQQTFLDYRQTSVSERATWLLQAADLLEQNAPHFGKIITLEMGKPIKAAIAEVSKCAVVCRFYAEQAAAFLADTPVTTDASYSYVRYDPLGAILAVMPWNFPFWQVFRFAAPALMAGNVGLLKHASNVPQSALAIEQIFREAGFPEGVFQTLLIPASKVADLMGDERIKAATLTGSEAAGISLAMAAGKHLKKVVLELGGSDPFIVLESANLEAAINTAVTARTMNNGQSCIAAKRFIVAEAIASEFETRFAEKLAQLKIGDPMDETTQIGPLATPSILSELDHLVQQCVQQGAKVVTGGKPLDRPGNYYPPTLLTNLLPGSPAYTEEFFGPVALIFPVPNLDQAIRLANHPFFGLGASAWTNNEQERDRLIAEIEAGSVFINEMVKSDPRLPFGGIKRSGYGRELSVEGIREFVNIKTIWIK